MKKLPLFSRVFLLAALLLAYTRPVYGQEDSFGIHLRREFGYGAGSNVRGNFTISLTGDESQVASVAFLIDGEVMAMIDQAPFRFQFHTDSYGFGLHWLSAQVTLQDGRVESTSAVRLNFITPEEEQSSLVMIFGGLGAVLVLTLVIYALIQMLVFKRKPSQKGQHGETRNYGLLGAAICPKCGKPFPRHIWGMNLVAGKFDRCEHCGKWSMTRRATPEELRIAVETEISVQPASEQEIANGQVIKDKIDDTRFMDKI